MAVQLHSVLISNTNWKYVASHANKLLEKYDFEEFEVLIRPDSLKDDELQDSNYIANFDADSKFLELVISADITADNFEFYGSDLEAFAEILVIGTLSQFKEDM